LLCKIVTYVFTITIITLLYYGIMNNICVWGDEKAVKSNDKFSARIDKFNARIDMLFYI